MISSASRRGQDTRPGARSGPAARQSPSAAIASVPAQAVARAMAENEFAFEAIHELLELGKRRFGGKR
jgi:hypothetical protein